MDKPTFDDMLRIDNDQDAEAFARLRLKALKHEAEKFEMTPRQCFEDDLRKLFGDNYGGSFLSMKQIEMWARVAQRLK